MEPELEFFLTFILHHGGKFVKDDKNGLEYVGGEIDVWEGLDVDTMCLWTPSDLCKEHGYVRFDNIWWHNPDFDLEKGLRPLAEDLDVRQMCNIGKVRDWEMHIYFEHPIDTPKISQKAPNDATIDKDLRRTFDDIVRMTMAPHYLEDNGSEDTKVVHKFADQINVKETESKFGDGGIEVEGSAEDITEFDGAVGADNIDTNVEDITEFDAATGADNTSTDHEEFNDTEGVAGADMGEDDGGKGSSDEDRTYEASEESSGDDYESESDSPYRPPTFQCDDEDGEDSAVPRKKKKVGENVGSSSRQRRQVGSSGSGGSGGSLDGGVEENMATGEEDAVAGEGDPATEGAAAPAAGTELAANDHQAIEINLSQSAPLSQGIHDYEIEAIVNDIPSHNAKTQTVNEVPNLELPPQTVVRPPPVRTKWNARAPIHTNPPPIAPPATRLGSPPSMPPPTRGVYEDTFQVASRGVQQRFMKFMPTPRLHQNPPSNK
ncbi:hypothetical protein SESBI_32855 [Sesbania bispinosa]|nr:hypothetical protein SESBI_32855 [Sesbania bispinosa]